MLEQLVLRGSIIYIIQLNVTVQPEINDGARFLFIFFCAAPISVITALNLIGRTKYSINSKKINNFIKKYEIFYFEIPLGKSITRAKTYDEILSL